MFSVFVAFFVFIHLVFGQTDNRPSVNLDIGTIVGTTETVRRESSVHTVKEFLGIPFAQPPVGNLRFKKPVSLGNLESNPYDASYYRPSCPQANTFFATPGVQDEDCLYLNVFVPDSAADKSEGFAVMFWIYGGGFQVGSSNDYHSARLAATGKVIVVTINYRIGPFGFLSTMDDNSPGNYGLYDQIMALDWVQNNIERFGGDTKRVTIFGASAGAMSTSYQSLYEKNQGKFHRVITQSGTALAVTPRDTIAGVKVMAQHLYCPTDDMKQAIDCLKEVPWKTFIDKCLELRSDPRYAALVDFMPQIDGDLIKLSYDMLAEIVQDRVPDQVSFFRSLDYLGGFNAYEGGLFLRFLVPEGVNNFQPSADTWYQFIDTLFYMSFGQSVSEDVKRTMLHEYTNWSNPMSYENIRLQITKSFGDRTFNAPTVQKSRLHLEEYSSRGTYMYHFMPALSRRMPVTPTWLPGADHGEEVFMVFGDDYDEWTDWERKLSERIVTYWTNFAKSGYVYLNVYAVLVSRMIQIWHL